MTEHAKVILVLADNPLLKKWQGKAGIVHYVEKKYFAICLRCKCKIQDYHKVDKR